MKFSDIPQMTRANYAVDVPWDGLFDHLARFNKRQELDLDPDFQREHVWTEEQKT